MNQTKQRRQHKARLQLVKLKIARERTRIDMSVEIQQIATTTTNSNKTTTTTTDNDEQQRSSGGGSLPKVGVGVIGGIYSLRAVGREGLFNTV